MASVSRALTLLKGLPRVTLGTLKPLPGRLHRKKCIRGQYAGSNNGRGNRPDFLPRIGFEGGNVPFYLRMPMEPYYKDFFYRKQYPPLSLLQLQRLIDLGRINLCEPIDLTTLCNTNVINVKPEHRHYGINLVDEGADTFQAKVNIEVQWTNELAIAAIEKNGGRITTKFYDMNCVDAMVDPARFFQHGKAIPRCKFPSEDVIEYYSSAKNRGYLSDPDLIQKAREELADRMGYVLPDLSNDHLYKMLTKSKDPRQIWFNLSPGWVVDLKNQTVLKPKDKAFREYYQS